MINFDVKNSVSFKSLRQEKLIGEKIIRDINNEIGFVNSSSNVGLRKIQLEKTGRLSKENPLHKKLSIKEEQLENEIYDDFISSKIMKKSNFKSIDELESQLINNIQKKEGRSNCLERMLLVTIRCLRKNIQPHILELRVLTNSHSIPNHYTDLIGLKKDAIVSCPETWGSKALIYDAFTGTVKPAIEGIKDIELMLLAGREHKQTLLYNRDFHLKNLLPNL